MLPHEALAAAAAEGLTLASADNSTGFWGVGKKGAKYCAQYRKPGVDQPIYIGQFACAEEAALAVVRHFPQAASVAAEAEAKKAVAAAKDSASALTVEDVERIASEEGLTLLRDPRLSSATGGWRGVSFIKAKKKYMAQRVGGGAKSSGSLGLFRTPHEAGLAVARALGPERSAAEAGTRRNSSGWSLHDDHELPTEHATRLAKEEGLTLRRKHSSADYWCVVNAMREGMPRWHAQLNAGAQLGGYKASGVLHLGAFASPEAAALAIARRLRDQPELEARARRLQQLSKARAQRAPASQRASACKRETKKRMRTAELEEDDDEGDGDYEPEGDSEGEGEGDPHTRGNASSGGAKPLDAEVLEVEAFEMWSEDEDEEVPLVTAEVVT